MTAPQAERNSTFAAEGEQSTNQQETLLLRVGQMTRSLHENLSALGIDGLVERVANDMPDARARLDYVARMTEQAAQRVLNATDAALPLQEKIESDAGAIASEWQAALGAPFSEEQFRRLAAQTSDHLELTRQASAETRQHLLAIMMAQDFQDLTGQVIKKITTLAHDLEQQLVQLLVEYSPSDMKREGNGKDADANAGLLNGPQINPQGNPDVVAGQQQVDDLLESLGF